jgi:DNA-binding transcriptional LysR family regulator
MSSLRNLGVKYKFYFYLISINFIMVDFEWYRSFIAVYRAGTVTGAAQARHLTQPAISQHIAALESHTGHALFERRPRRMEPTAQGKTLYTHLAASMDNLERLSNTLQALPAREIPSVRLGTPFDYFHERGWERLKDAPLRLQVSFGETDDLIDELSQGRLDAAIATQQVNASHIDNTRIETEEFCLVAAADSPPLKSAFRPGEHKEGLETALLNYAWISYSQELPIIRRFWQVVFGKRPELVPLAVVPSLLTIRRMVESGRGISVLPRYLCEQALNEGRLKELWRPLEPISNDLWIATRKVDRNSPKLAQLKALLIPAARESLG